MENKSIFDMYPDTMFKFKIGNRGMGKFEEMKNKLPILMTKYEFVVSKYKDTTIIKLREFDDIYIFYKYELKLISDIRYFKLKSGFSLAQKFDSAFRFEEKNRIFGGFNHK